MTSCNIDLIMLSLKKSKIMLIEKESQIYLSWD